MISLFRLSILGVAGLLIMASALASAAVPAQDDPVKTTSIVAECPVGLAVDNRCNAYTADRKTGHVFCIAPSQEPVLLARVPGAPTLVAVDSLRNVFVGTESGRIFLVGRDGSVTEVYKCKSGPVGLGVDRDGGLVVATREGEIITVQRDDFLR